MNIELNSVVSLDYVLRNEDGELLDESGADPLTYLHGHSQLIPGVEKALLGKTVGDELRFMVEPEEAYGDYDPDAVQKVDRSAFPPDAVIEEGMEFFAEDEDGNNRPVSILAIEGEEIMLDFNHPLAGEALDFEIKVREVRVATPEELEHGHVHGEDGHHHDHDHDHDHDHQDEHEEH